MYKLIAFDMDGTLAASKSAIDDEMALLLKILCSEFFIAIISGWDFPQFQKQLLPYLQRDATFLEKLFILPTCGTKMYRYTEDTFTKMYEDPINTQDKKNIIHTLELLYEQSWYKPKNIYGEVVEDRITQITFSALGQEAPLSLKEQWDPTKEKRQSLIDQIKNIFPNYSFNFWWTTSIDITKQWIDKSYGVYKIMSILDIEKKDIAFVGDRLEQWGNDYPIKAMGIDSRETSWPEQTKQIIQEQFLSHF